MKINRTNVVIAALAFMVFSASLCFAGAKGTAGKKTPPPPTPPVFEAHFCGNDLVQSSSCDVANNAFDINTTRDVTIFVSWQNLTGAHVQRLVFIMPNGDPYQAMSTAFDTTTGQGLQTTVPYPTVSNVLPVAGTWIQQRAVTGTWTVQVFLDEVYVGQTSLNFY